MKTVQTLALCLQDSSDSLAHCLQEISFFHGPISSKIDQTYWPIVFRDRLDLLAHCLQGFASQMFLSSYSSPPPPLSLLRTRELQLLCLFMFPLFSTDAQPLSVIRQKDLKGSFFFIAILRLCFPWHFTALSLSLSIGLNKCSL